MQRLYKMMRPNRYGDCYTFRRNVSTKESVLTIFAVAISPRE
ncbi:MAG: hypothetical protein RIG63_20410 [Coleofasciculus chthonoplastes F3-SA18-01]|jgi:hypothetical protein